MLLRLLTETIQTVLSDARVSREKGEYSNLELLVEINTRTFYSMKIFRPLLLAIIPKRVIACENMQTYLLRVTILKRVIASENTETFHSQIALT